MVGDGEEGVHIPQRSEEGCSDPEDISQSLGTPCGDEEDSNLHDLCGDSGMLEIWEEVDCLIAPLDVLFREKDASLFFSHLPKIITKLLSDNHPRLLKGYLPFLHLLQHWRLTNPFIITFISRNIHQLNDTFIEHFNSIVSRGRTSHTRMEFQHVVVEVLAALVRREVDDQLRRRARESRRLCRSI